MDWLMSVSLVSPVVTWALYALTVAVVVLVVVKWGALAKRTPLAVAGRVVTLLVVSLLIASSFAAPVNAKYGWYPTIGDFFPSTEHANLSSQGAAPAQAVAAVETSSPLITGPRNRPELQLNLTETASGAGGGYQDFTVAGPRSGVTATVTVWFPKEYLEEPSREFPVIEAFHGIEPAPYAWFKVVNLDATIEQLVAEKRMGPAIVVIPHWALNRVDNECVNSAQGGQVETWVSEDVPAWVYNTFRAKPGRDAFAALGLSAGGWCASMAAMLHPDVFATAISYGGYFRPIFEHPFEPFGPGSDEWTRYDLVAVAAEKAPPVAMWAMYGENDWISKPTTVEFAQAVRPPTSFSLVHLDRGSHNTSLWLPFVPRSLDWLAQTSPEFSA